MVPGYLMFWLNGLVVVILLLFWLNLKANYTILVWGLKHIKQFTYNKRSYIKAKLTRYWDVFSKQYKKLDIEMLILKWIWQNNTLNKFVSFGFGGKEIKCVRSCKNWMGSLSMKPNHLWRVIEIFKLNLNPQNLNF